MFRIFILLLLINNFSCASLANEISNSVEPVSYFSGRSVELEDLKRNIDYYKKASIVGISGIGKTQLIRTFVQSSIYNLVWFFDCNRDFDAQYLHLAKYINQTIKDKSLIIDENYAGIKERVLDYLKSKKHWLLVYDNLKLGQNYLIKDITELEANGDIIIASQDGINLPNTIYLHPLSETESLDIINKILPDNKDSNYLNNIFKGYPLLISKGLMLLKNNNSYLSEDYNKILTEQTPSIKSYTEFLLKNSSPSIKEMLLKIAVINNQSFSKNFLEKIISNKQSFTKDLDYLINLGLISIIKNSENNKIFEMHEAIKEQIISSISHASIRNTINDVVTKALSITPILTTNRYLFFVNDQTILSSFEKLLFNAELYKIKKEKTLNLREKLISFYFRQRNLVKCKEMAKWLNNNYWYLWLMNNDDLATYAAYLNYISLYEEWENGNFSLSIKLKDKAKKILMKLKNYNEIKFQIFIQRAQSYVALGNFEKADKNIIIAEEFIENKHQEEMLWFLKARIFFGLMNFEKALKAINNSIEINKKYYSNVSIIPVFLMKAKILNYLKNYQEAYEILKKIYLIERANVADHNLLISVCTGLSYSLLGIGKINTAYVYATKAKDIALKKHQKLSIKVSFSQDWYLALALKTEADCLNALGNYSQALKNYAQAEAIFYNVYRENMKNNPTVESLYFNATKAACKLKDKFWFNKFKTGHLSKFGLDHPKSVEIQNMQCF